MNDKSNNCRVCGLDQGFSPWGENDNVPSYFICPCCGAEFGLHDETYDQIKEYREQWLTNGAKWFDEKHRPEGWDRDSQLKGIPDLYI